MIAKKLITLFLLLPCFLFAEEIVVPIMVGQTGASATFGDQELKAYKLARDEWNQQGGINGKNIKFLLEDTETKQKSVLSAFYRIGLVNPIVILGPTWLDTFAAIIPLAKKKDVAIVTPSSAVEALTPYGGYPITMYFNTTLEIQGLINGLKKEHQAKTFGIIYEREPFAEFVATLFRDQSDQLILDKGIQGGETDFRALLSKLVRRNKLPDVLVVLIWDESSLISFFQQVNIFAPQLKLATIHDGEGWIKNENFKPFIKQLIYSKFLLFDKTFIEKFKKAYNEEPILTASTAYDAANAVFNALKSGASNGTEVREYLRSNELETSSFGPVRLTPEGGIPVSEVKIVNYQKESLN